MIRTVVRTTLRKSSTTPLRPLFGMDSIDTTGWAAVVPKEDCPHIATAVRSPPKTGLDGCGRHVSQHGLAHYAENPNHCVWLGIQDLSFWCHKCEAYLVHDQLGLIGNLMHIAIFEEPAPDFTLQASRAKPNPPPSPRRPRATASTSTSTATAGTSGSRSGGDSKGKGKGPATGPPVPDPPKGMSPPMAEDKGELGSAVAAKLAAMKIEDTAPAAPAIPKGLDDNLVSVGKGASVVASSVVLPEPTMEAVAAGIKAGRIRNVVVMTGAGISVSAGIPDFRSPGTGLYDNLQRFNLPRPEAVFDLDFFKNNPDPFLELAKEMWPGNFEPTPTHYFIRLLHEKGLLSRLYTQNIDTLERQAGIPGEKIVEAHGAFHGAKCVECDEEHETEWIRKKVFSDPSLPRAERLPTCVKCKDGLVKPNIVFFGENLPERFFRLRDSDLAKADLLIVAGTSLQVHPFAGLIHDVKRKTPRMLFNRERVAESGRSKRRRQAKRAAEAAAAGKPPPEPEDESDSDDDGGRAELMSLLARLAGGGDTNFDFEAENGRDVAVLGDCDDGFRAFANALGWADELEALVAGRGGTSS